jgi:hypothetical protein
MASLHIAIGYSQGRGLGGAQLPVVRSVLDGSELLPTTGTSAQATLTATAAQVNNGALWILTAIGGDVLVTCGPNPTAAVANAHRIPVGTTRELAITAANEKVAGIDA